ncbi:SURP and G-patch domain-containing protein 2 isoform X2 [Pseudophryne corroboree]|uniref:SURP and G-patch domain-containing protein 2 isoform X2 n=1 Tax=Pseudophryne corroboree TaxID=495146 RepID=UPI003081D915
MASQRITRDTFDALVQEKMKRYRVSMDQAISDTVDEFHLEGPLKTRMSRDTYESLQRERQRYSLSDPPQDSLSRNRNADERDRILNESYTRELDRETTVGRLSDSFLERWSSADLLLKEKLYQEALNASNRRLSESDKLRSLERNDLNLGRRDWELERDIFREPELYREFRSTQSAELGHGKGTFRSQGQMPQKQTHGRIQNPVGKGPVGAQFKSGGKANTKEQASNKSGNFDSNNPSLKFSEQILKWSKFYTKELGSDLLYQHTALFKVETVTCKMAVDCFKGSMTLHHRKRCFSDVKNLSHPALKNPRVDNDLLDLLVQTKTVSVKNDFFEAIKPLDKEMIFIQQHLLKCVTPSLIACNTFELKNAVLTDPRQVLEALKKTIFLCRKTIVLIGQTFAMITAVRQNNILETLGISQTELTPSAYPNFTNSFLFGMEFMSQLKGWLGKSGNKLTLKSRHEPTGETSADKEKALKTADKEKALKTADKEKALKTADKEKALKTADKEKALKTDAESQGKAADPKDIATIDQLLEHAKKGDKIGGEKPAFWWLFDKNSNEYKYYQQKFEEYQETTGQMCIKNTHLKTAKKSPEELACESVRAMLYARKAQSLKKRLFKCVVYSRKQKLIKARRQRSKKAVVKVEEVTQDVKQETANESTPEASACKEVVLEKTPDKCSATSETEPDKLLTNIKESSTDKSLDVDEKTQNTAIKLAQFVVQMGPEIEQFSMENSINNPEFWFLRDKDSPAYIFYKSKLEELKQAEEKMTSDDEEGGDLQDVRQEDVEMEAEFEAAVAPEGAAALDKMATSARPPPIARKRVAKLKVGMLAPKRVCLVDEPKIHDPVPIEYDRPRGRGYNRKKKPVDLEFANKKITQQNVGFQMLSKMGWQEGQGLGSGGSGIKNPIKVGSVSAGEGLGVKVRETTESTSDNYDAFRQRMMHIYKKKITK